MRTEPKNDPLNSRELRKMLGQFPTGVVAVTACLPNGAPAGIAMNAFSSLSLTPPMILLCPAATSQTWPELRRQQRLGISLLAADQERHCRQLAGPAEHRFKDVSLFRGTNGAPLIEGAVGWLTCTLVNEFGVGDHFVAVAEVATMYINEQLREPLIFFRGNYHGSVDLRSAS